MCAGYRDAELPVSNWMLVAVAVVAALGFITVTTYSGTAAATFDPDPDTAGTDDEISTDIEISEPTLVNRFLSFELPPLAFVDPVDETVEPGGTVEVEFTGSADIDCDDPEYRVEVREPGSSSTDYRDVDSLGLYGSVSEDMLISGTAQIDIPETAPEGEWDVMGYAHCPATGDTGSPDTDTFTVEAADDQVDTGGDVPTETRWIPTDGENDCVSEEVEEGLVMDPSFNTQEACLNWINDQDTDTGDGDDDTERHWITATISDLWTRLTGWI